MVSKNDLSRKDERDIAKRREEHTGLGQDADVRTESSRCWCLTQQMSDSGTSFLSTV